MTSSQLRIASLWDLKSGKVTQLDAHRAPILSAAFSPDGAWLVTASWDRTARVWDARTGGGIAVLKGHTDRVISVVFSPDSAQVISASEDQSARIWDAATGAQIESVSWNGEPVRFAARFAAFSPDRARMILLSEGKTARVAKLSWPLKGDAFAIACARLGNNIDLADVREHYGLGESPLSAATMRHCRSMRASLPPPRTFTCCPMRPFPALVKTALPIDHQGQSEIRGNLIQNAASSAVRGWQAPRAVDLAIGAHPYRRS